ncbi:MAG: DUF2993 domain-containing protein [Mycobacteriales bacterium]
MRRLLFTLVVIVALLFVADRAALAGAQSRLAAEVQRQENLPRKPSAKLIGFPFLTQALSGHYQGGRIQMDDLRTQKLLVSNLTIDLRNVDLPVTRLVSGKVGVVPVGKVTGVAMVSYSELARATGVPGLRISPKGEKLELRFAIDQFGTSTPVVATARVGVGEQAVRITSVQIQGAALPDQLTSAALGQIQSSLAFGVLPYGLKVSDVRVADTGIEVSAQASNTVLHPPATG